MPKGRNWIDVTTMGDLVDRRAEAHPDRDAVIFPDARVTYRELADRSDDVARGLLALGVESGDRVGYFLPDGVDCAAILLGAAKVGAIAVPVNARLKPREVLHVVTHSGMKVLFSATTSAGTNLIGVIQEALAGLASGTPGDLALADAPELRAVVALDDTATPGTLGRAGFARQAAGVDPADVDRAQAAVRVRDTAVIVYTSGTTATPKGAMLSHEAFCRLAEGCMRHLWGLGEGEKMWMPLPMFHIGGIGFLFGCLYLSAALVHSGHFDPGVALAQLRDEECVFAFPGFETIWLPILNHPDRTDADLSTLRAVWCIGVEERLRQIQDATPHAVLLSGFGMTESCANLTSAHPTDTLDQRIKTGGLPLPGMECEVHDPETGELLPPGSTGELWFRGPSAFDGYFRDPEANEQSFDRRGFFKSGDIMRMDPDGRLTFVSRVKDMIKVGGENVAAAELEGYLLTHPAVHSVQVVAAPDAKYVEVPAAFIQLKPEASATEQEIIDFCRGQIASFRVPRYVRFVTEWPMSATKIKKITLREMIAQELADAGITEAPRISS
ncbi:MAG TPA: AMP-binding protein [Acidimicrobiia bacterium]|nr:AMP-binding protein [Acidimicrobiia bacterium]